jgi:hypothetical protein
MPKYYILGFTILLSASCASTQPQRPFGFDTYDAAVVNVTPSISEQSEAAEDLQSRIVEALVVRQVFHTVRTGEEAGAEDGVIIRLGITRLRKESNIDRLTLGRMAGSNVVATDVAVIDARTQQVLSEFPLEGESPDYPPSFDWPWGSLEEAMERLARRLANILLEWKHTAGG